MIADCCYGPVGPVHPASPGGVSVIVKKFFAMLLGTLAGEGPIEDSAPSWAPP
jgi:hypothetical protein